MKNEKISKFFRNKVVLLTGASSGIGRALSYELAQYHPRLVLLARNINKLEEIACDISDTTEVFYKKCDVRDPEDIKNAVADTVEKWQRIDLAILCAGADVLNSIDRYSTEIYRTLISTNYLQAVDFLENLLEVYRIQGEGRIVAISSLADGRGMPFGGAYAASKAALLRFLESVRFELGLSGIGVTIIRPGFVDTPMTKQNNFKMPFVITPEHAAKKISSAICRGKKEMSFPFFSSLVLSILKMLPIPILDYIHSRYYKKVMQGMSRQAP